MHTDEQILDAALQMFATHGFEGTSLRSLNRELGLSHSAVHQRFGTKEDLYKAVIDHEFKTMFGEIRTMFASQPTPKDPIDQLHRHFTCFLLVSSRHPFMNRLMNNEGLEPSWHLDHIYSRFVSRALRPIKELMDELARKKVLKPVGVRMPFFLIAHGAAAIYTLRALSSKFDANEGQFDEVKLAEEAAWIVVNGMKR
jgi:AcrR family transcriptional regulator